MSTDLELTVRTEDLALRRMFAKVVVTDDFTAAMQKDPSVFHHTLHLALSRNWLHPDDVAKKVGSSQSNTRKWFKTDLDSRSTPNHPMMVAVFEAVADLLSDDIEVIEKELYETPVTVQVQRAAMG